MLKTYQLCFVNMQKNFHLIIFQRLNRDTDEIFHIMCMELHFNLQIPHLTIKKNIMGKTKNSEGMSKNLHDISSTTSNSSQVDCLYRINNQNPRRESTNFFQYVLKQRATADGAGPGDCIYHT